MEIIWLAVAVLIVVALIYFLSRHGRLKSVSAGCPAAKEEARLTTALLAHVYKLSHEIGIRDMENFCKLNEAADYIAQKFRECGYEAEFQYYDVHDQTVRNIIAIKTGSTQPEEVIVVGAHYDSYSNPGADDNASGVAALLELARLTAVHPTGKSVEFVAFVNEELPFFHTEKMGSRIYTQLAKDRGKNIRAGLVLEMLGFYSEEANSQYYPPGLEALHPDKANFIALVGNRASASLAAQTVSSFKTNTPFPIEYIAGDNIPEAEYSDNWSFWQEGYPALMITDTSFFRYMHYHKDSDTYEKLNYQKMSQVVQGLHAVIMDLAR